MKLLPVACLILASACLAPVSAFSTERPARDAVASMDNGSPWTTAKPVVHEGRNGPLTDREMAMARAAWAYFVGATQEKTGLANAVGSYPSTTLWDTASYISALVSARELGIIDKREFDLRTLRLLATVRNLDLFRGELPNKAYDTRTAAKVDYANKPGEIGYSANDIGRLLVWLAIVRERYPYLANSVDQIPLRWNFCHVIDGGELQGAGVGKDGQTTRYQEGRLGYEEYAAKGFGLWGFRADKAARANPYAFIDIYGVQVPYDARDPRVYKTKNYVVSEPYILEGIELDYDLPDDTYSDALLHTDGWRAEFAQRVYMAQQRRFEETGILTARTEHQVDGAPFFVYDSVFADGYAWNTLSPDGEYQPDRAAIAVKGALGLWALWDTPYTSKLFEAVADLYTPDGGFYEGLYESGKGFIPVQTANNNGIILAALLYKVQGPIYRRLNPDAPLWFTANADSDLRAARCLPDRPLQVECPLAACGADQPGPSLPADGFQYCRTVAASKWYPGCAAAHPDLAARNCKPGPPRTVAAAKVSTPGSLCPLDGTGKARK